MVSLSAVIWVALAGTLIVLSLRRPAYAVALYMMTFFAAPHLWWWGGDLPSMRYSLIAGVLIIGALILRQVLSHGDPHKRFSLTHTAAIGMAANATFVHFVLASYPGVSVDNYVELLKYVLLFFLIWSAIRNKEDLRIVIMAIAIGAGYIGYEVTINERGKFRGSRLEGVGAPAADTSNSLASVMLLSLPLAGSLLSDGKGRHKVVAAVAAPLVLNVVLLCNSRGAFLGLIGAGGVFLLLARGAARRQALKALVLGGATLFLLLGDPKILDRFSTTFVGSEERDTSAASRLQFWQAGLLMLKDYPLGDGGGSFKFNRGGSYITKASGLDSPERSLHNGYLTEATEWGIQGLVLRLIFIFGPCAYAYRTIVLCRIQGRGGDSLVGISLISALGGFLVASMFGSFLSNEWSYWVIPLLLKYGDLYRVPETSLVDDSGRQNRHVDLPRWTPTARAG